MSSLSKSIFTTLLSQIFTQFFGIIAGVFITRLLGAEGRGVYALFYADVALFNTILGFSINTAIIHYSAKKELSESKILSISVFFVFLTVLSSMLILLISFLLSFSEFLFPSTHVSFIYLIWFILFLLVTQVNVVYSSIFQGAKMFDVVNKVSIVNSILNVIIFLFLFILNYLDFLDVSLLVILLFALLILFINTFQWHFHYKKSFKYNFDFNLKWKRDIKPFFSFTGLGHLSNVINFFNYRFVLWVLAYYLDNISIGIFSLGAGLTQMLSFLSVPLSQVLMPFMSAEKDETRIKMFTSFARLHFSIISIISLIGIILVPFLIPVVYGKEFTKSVVVFSVIIWGVVISSQSRLIASYFISIGKIKINLIATIFGFLITFMLNVYLVKIHGIVGAAFSQVLTYFGIFVFVYIVLLREIGLTNFNIFIINKSDLNYAKRRIKEKTGRN